MFQSKSTVRRSRRLSGHGRQNSVTSQNPYDETHEEIFTPLSHIPNILQLYYDRCAVHNVPQNPHISVALKTGCSVLGFWGCFTANDLLPLGDVLEQDETITSLDLSGSTLSSSVCYMLCKALEHNTSVTHINLNTNRIDSHGGAALATLLRVSPTLRVLRLRNNLLYEVP